MATRSIHWLLGWLVVLIVEFLRASCRMRLHNDPRPQLRSVEQAYAFSVLHAHQVSAIMGAEAGTGAMVSRSRDGGFLIRCLRRSAIVPVRGSGDRCGRDKGGSKALNALILHLRRGSPVLLAVDGPRGPRNRVQRGIAVLSQRTGASVINVVSVPEHRWILSGSWDRLQIPMPFSRIDVYFGEPLRPAEGESTDAYRLRIEQNLNSLEQLHDPAEAARLVPRDI